MREKAHTRDGDAIAAARRRLPMVEVDPSTPLTGVDGPVPLIDVFEGRTQLFASYHMWHTGRSAADQCEGTSGSTGPLPRLSQCSRGRRPRSCSSPRPASTSRTRSTV
uniref:DUF899 family protein n=1 Tax=Paractinoplanes polyasparticus TaxID=2856853 RepID=UPI0027E0A4E8|nr:DUF899 family protein [Actinoplanes polyasparticus]